jgi:hypothetical protein
MFPTWICFIKNFLHVTIVLHTFPAISFVFDGIRMIPLWNWLIHLPKELSADNATIYSPECYSKLIDVRRSGPSSSGPYLSGLWLFRPFLAYPFRPAPRNTVHLNQAIFRHIKKIGLGPQYRKNKQKRTVCRELMSLNLLPAKKNWKKGSMQLLKK